MIPTYIDYLPQQWLPIFGDLEDLADISWVRRTETRQECFMSDTPRTYRYGSGRGERTYTSVPFTPYVRALVERINRRMGKAHNVCFANFYADERQHLGWHADDDPGTDHTHDIDVLSFGAVRGLWIRLNGHRGPVHPEWKYLLAPGSMFTMPAGFQQEWEHRIPKHDRQCGPRVSLTLRKIL